MYKKGSRRKPRTIDPIPYRHRHGESKDFDISLSPEELEQVKDDFGEVRYEKVHEFLLTKIGGMKYFDWLAARMRNYMIFLIHHRGYKPRFYNPSKGKVL